MSGNKTQIFLITNGIWPNCIIKQLYGHGYGQRERTTEGGYDIWLRGFMCHVVY